MDQPDHCRISGSPHLLHHLCGAHRRTDRVEPSLVDAHSRTSLEHPLAGHRRRFDHTAAGRLPRLDHRSVRISWSPGLGMGTRLTPRHADLCAGLCVCPSSGNGRPGGTRVADAHGVRRATALPSKLCRRHTDHGPRHVSVCVPAGPRSTAESEYLLRGSGTRLRRFSLEHTLARHAPAHPPRHCRRTSARDFVCDLGLRGGLSAPLPDTHVCGLSTDDQPLRPYVRQHSQPAPRRDGNHLPGHGTMVSPAESLLPNIRPLSTSDPAPRRPRWNGTSYSCSEPHSGFRLSC